MVLWYFRAWLYKIIFSFFILLPFLKVFFLLFFPLISYLSVCPRWWRGHVCCQHCVCGDGFNRRCSGGLRNTALARRSIINTNTHTPVHQKDLHIHRPPPCLEKGHCARTQITLAEADTHIYILVCVSSSFLIITRQCLSSSPVWECTLFSSCLSNLCRQHAKLQHPPADEEHGEQLLWRREES